MVPLERRREIEAATKSEWDRQLLLMVEPLFTASKIHWHLFKKLVVFKQCTLNQPIKDKFVQGEVVERIELVFDEKHNWHASIFRTREDRSNPVRMFFHATVSCVTGACNDVSQLTTVGHRGCCSGLMYFLAQ